MEEQKIVKKQLLKSMFLTFITFTIIFSIFDLIIYNLIWASLYNSIDEEIMNAKIEMQEEKNLPFEIGEKNELEGDVIEGRPEIIQNRMQGKKELMGNPRLMYILRDENGNVTNESSIGSFVGNFIEQIEFDKENLNEIYTASINSEFYYRGINRIRINSVGEKEYVQILVNVDGEIQSLSNTLRTLIITTIIMVLISIIISYILSKRTLKPIIESWNRQTEFVQNASHELRTPLTIIQAKQELLLQEPNKKIIDKSQDITVCLNETRRLSKMIKELMTLARADSNKLEINKEKTDIDNLIKVVTEPYIEMANMQDKSVDLKLNFNKEIEVDKNKISELLIIILDNAIKYTAEGESITIFTQSRDNKLVLEIADTGIGISKEALKHIFDRFYREDKARSRETGGTGLGLSIAQTIVNYHNGSIKILQNEPKGTKVIIKI